MLEEERRRTAATLPHALLFITQMRIVVPVAALADMRPRALQRERDDLIEYVRLLGDSLPRRIARLCTAALIGDNGDDDDNIDEEEQQEEEEEMEEDGRAASTDAV